MFNKDPIDLKPLVSSPELDKYAELQSRYAKLKRKYHDISAQYNTQVERLRNENEDLKD